MRKWLVVWKIVGQRSAFVSNRVSADEWETEKKKCWSNYSVDVM